MIDIDQLREERDGLRSLRAQILRYAPASDDADATLREIDARLAEIADELIGPCIVV